ncbi:hypothetical protein [Streptomyces sp. NPDC003395]
MRPEVRAFVAAGPLPGEHADKEEIARRDAGLRAIAAPVTAEEAGALADCFGPDDCYGLAWSLLHLVETGPCPVVTERPDAGAGMWPHRLWRRAVDGGLVTGEEGRDGEGGGGGSFRA